MEILDLNDDVLAVILSCVDKQDLVSLMATCYTMYDLAIPYLLSSVDLRRHVKQIFEFCQFVLKSPREHGRGNGGGDRNIPSLIRSLHMVDGATIPNTDPPFSSTLDFSGLLVRVLEQARNLRELHIENVELLIGYEPRICEAIVRLPALSGIFFTGAHQKSFDMILRMRDLRHVHVQHPSDLIPVIRPFQSTLESVSSEYKHWRNFVDLQSLSDTDQWPHVRSLKLGVINVRSYRLVHAFPNLRALRLQAGVPSAKDEALEKGPKRCWSNLDYVEGLVVELYQVALTCPIRELRFNSPPASLRSLLAHTCATGPFGPPAMFLDIIRTAGPTALSFPVSPTMQDEGFFRQLAALLPQLKVLGLLVDFDPTKTLSHLKRITKWLESVPVVYFTLELSHSTPTKVSQEERPMFLDPALSIPTVRYIELQMRGNPKHPAFRTKMRIQTTWWRVNPEEGSFEQISGELGRQLREIYVAGG